MVSKTYSADELPEFQPLRHGAKKKYPWFTCQPGEGFKFDAGVPLAGARSQVANAMNQPLGIGKKFIVRLDQQNNIWAIRIDGLPLEVREQWRKKRAEVAGAEGISPQQFGAMQELGPHQVDVSGSPGYVAVDEPEI